jgi:hypothetical protein
MSRGNAKFSSPRSRPSKAQKSYPQAFVKPDASTVHVKLPGKGRKTGQFGVV